MNIAIDCTFFGHNEIETKKLSLSTSIFTADILDAFSKLGFSSYFTLIVNYNHEAFFKERFPMFKIFTLKFFPLSIINKLTFGAIKGTRYLKKFGFFNKALLKSGIEGVWFPYCVDYTYVKTTIPSLCTIHDVYRVHKYGKKGWDFINNTNCKLTTVSDYTKKDIVKTFELEESKSNKIITIPNSITLDVSKQKKIPILEGIKYILDLNAFVAKKNPMILLKAFNLIKNGISEKLVFCGGYKDESLFEEMKEYIRKENLVNRVILLFQISDEERNWLLSNATIFVTPSLFEGFGRTPVEAAICKIPVISTKETSLYEATMGLCNYVENALDEVELSNLLLNKLKNPENYEKLENIAKTLTTNYEPEGIAKKYLEVLNDFNE